MDIDGEAALRCWAVTVELAGVEHRIAPRPAAEWMLAAAADDWLRIVPGWLDDPDPVDEMFLAGEVAYEDLRRAARDALTAAAGTAWWSAQRLLVSGMNEPGVMGRLVLARVDLTTAPLGAVVAAMYHIYTRNADKPARARLDAELDKPPAGVTPGERFDEDAMAASFERMYAARGGGVR